MCPPDEFYGRAFKRRNEMEEIVNLIQTVGFPIAISTYLLFVFGAKIDRLTDAVEKLADLFDKNEKVKE
jgi:hypothetical protein